MKTLHAARHDGLDSILPWRNVCLSLPGYLFIWVSCAVHWNPDICLLYLVISSKSLFCLQTFMTYKWASALADLDQMLGALSLYKALDRT